MASLIKASWNRRDRPATLAERRDARPDSAGRHYFACVWRTGIAGGWAYGSWLSDQPGEATKGGSGLATGSG